MKQKVVMQQREIKFEKKNGQIESVILPLQYQDFQREMLSKYQYPETTNYIYQDDNEDEITIDSSRSYNQMQQRLLQKSSYQLLKVKEEQEKIVIYKKHMDVKEDQNLKQKGDRENNKVKEIDEQLSIYFLNKNGEVIKNNLLLATNYDQFLKKMENQHGFAKTTKYVFAADGNEEIIIDSSSSYDQMLKNYKQGARTRTLKVKNDLLENQSLLQQKEIPQDFVPDLNYIDIFGVMNSKFLCMCKYQRKDPSQCKLCNGTALVDYQQSWQTDLSKEFEKLVKKNFQKIQKYLKDNYQEDIQTFTNWIEFQFKLVAFKDQESFYFKCIRCDKFYAKAKVVHFESLQIPKKPICDKCFQSNRIEGYLTSHGKCVQNNQQDEDQLPNKPPNLSQSIKRQSQ
ncbi:unnamed protein product [Paramecium octaurelia]|uniref:Uncharacterized protein n=1 Tax=Paramecium octaurelia TaxID=43137 RepID=A0A8S1VEH4_PAROT|nr:unnamed protein product [Paramecium octaurelia]